MWEWSWKSFLLFSWCSRIPAARHVTPAQSLFPTRFKSATAIAFPLGNCRFPTFFFWNPQWNRVNDNHSSSSLQDQGQSMVFLSLKSEPLITADCAKWKELSPYQCPGGSRGIFPLYVPPSLGDVQCGLPKLCFLAPDVPVPRLFPGANQQSWWQQKPWKDCGRCEPAL